MTVQGFYNALQALQRPGARLVRQHCNNNSGQCGYFIEPGNQRVSEAAAAALIEGDKLVPLDPGLLPDHPQSWCVRP